MRRFHRAARRDVAGNAFNSCTPPVKYKIGSERKGLWAYYYVKPEALEELSAWLS